MRSLVAPLLMLLSGGMVFNGAQAGGDSGGLTDLQVPIEYIDAQNRVVDARFQPGQLVLVFPYLPGRIFGTPGSDLLFTERLRPQGMLHLALGRARPVLQDGAATLRTGEATDGLSIRPARTRFARIGTFAFDAQTLEPAGAGGFIDGRTREHMILAYFDRPCVLSGTLHRNENEYVHTIEIPAAGFHFLRIEPRGAGRYAVQRAADTSAVVFSIQLLNLQQT